MKKKIMIVVIVLCIIFSSVSYFVLFNPSEKIYGETAVVSFYINDNDLVVFYCEIADSPDERSDGLMFRESLAVDKGMLFVYEESKKVCFWMKNCLIPLDIIFIDENMTVVNIEEAEIQKDVSDDELIRYCSNGPIKWVVEINKGFSESFEIRSGSKVKIEYL